MERVLSFFEDIPSYAQVVIGGERQGDNGFYVAPTVVGGLLQDDKMIQTEIFGPVITVQGSPTRMKC
jgi:betaine-aldehyde dehydrogenase